LSVDSAFEPSGFRCGFFLCQPDLLDVDLVLGRDVEVEVVIDADHCPRGPEALMTVLAHASWCTAWLLL
jgi:hypothetical protein